jgi:hypothetical protein
MKDGSLNVSIDAEWKENLKIINSDKVFETPPVVYFGEDIKLMEWLK